MGFHVAGQWDTTSPTRGGELFITGTIMVILAGLFVTGRLAARWASRKFGMDDYLIICALFCSVGVTVTMNLGVEVGYGKHVKDLTHEQMNAALKYFYWAQILYKMCLGFNKVSMLCLYLRIFIGTGLRRLCYISIGFITSWAVAMVITTIFQCLPIAAMWDKSIKNPTCISNDGFWFAYAISNTVTDALIFALPIREVIKLQLPKREKIGLVVVFAMGAFVCVTSIIRTTAVAGSTQQKKDQTWTFIPRSTWTLVEANTGIICACLPMLKLPLTMLFPRLFRGSLRSFSNRPNRSSYIYSSRSKGPKDWSQHDAITMATVSRGPPEKDPSSSHGSEEHIIGSETRPHYTNGIVRKTDVVVSFHDGRDESFPSSSEGR